MTKILYRTLTAFLTLALVAGCATPTEETIQYRGDIPTKISDEFRAAHIFKFKFDSHDIPQEFERSIQTHAQYIIDSGNRAYVQGSADTQGESEYNYELGLRRAQAVKNKLVSYGADPELIQVGSIGSLSRHYSARRALIAY